MCQMLWKIRRNNCKRGKSRRGCNSCRGREEAFFPVNKALQETLFPEETEQAKMRAMQKLKEKESGDKQ